MRSNYKNVAHCVALLKKALTKGVCFLILFLTLGINSLEAQNKAGIPCVTGGTILYKEDFGGNNPGDPVYPLNSTLRGYTGLPYSTSVIGGGGFYTLSKNYNLNGSYHWAAWDHTSLSDPTIGYMMYIDPSPTYPDAVLYSTEISYLCSDVQVTLSLWAASVSKTGQGQLTPKFELQIQDENGNILRSEYKELQHYASQAAWQWEQICVTTAIPQGKDKIKFVVLNMETSPSGNDWVIDDIEVRLITPTVFTTVNDNAITDVIIKDDAQAVQLKSTYVVDNTFGTNLTSYWLYSETGEFDDPSKWHPIDLQQSSTSVGATWKHDLNLLNIKEGYYRLAIGNSSEAITSLCRAASAPILIHK